MLGLFDYNTTLSFDPAHFNPDVKALQNELAWQGYLNREDIDGYFGPATLEAVNRYKNDKGLWNFGEYSGVVGLTTWQSLGLIYRDQQDIDAGVTIKTIGARQYFDISEAVNIAVIRATGEFQDHEYDFIWFIEKVKNEGEWNIKRNATVWSDTLGISERSYYYPLMFYGRNVVVDDVGNITYGYLGAAAGFAEWMLDAGSGGYHILNHGVMEWDNELADQEKVQLGVLWYQGNDIHV